MVTVEEILSEIKARTEELSSLIAKCDWGAERQIALTTVMRFLIEQSGVDMAECLGVLETVKFEFCMDAHEEAKRRTEG